MPNPATKISPVAVADNGLCAETVAPPDNGNTWICCECGAETELYKKCHAGKDYEPDNATEGKADDSELEMPLSLGILSEIFAQAEGFDGFTAKSAVALYDDVLFFRR